MIDEGMLQAFIIFLAVTSLYALLALFPRFLPTRFAAEVRKIDKVARDTTSVRCEAREEIARESLFPKSTDDLSGHRKRRSRLEKRLRRAAWSISPGSFRCISLAISLGFLIAVSPHVDLFVLPFAFLAGPFCMNALVRRSVERRTRRFSDDYPQFLMMMVALLKTGMTPSGALEQAAQGLEPSSLVRAEVGAMLERMRIGLPEERSIGEFGENIEHPEIELFVQSLLLGLRVGGSLTDSLERLSIQARKREHFKRSAVASVAQQRGSMIAIVVIMGGLGVFVAIIMPKLVEGLYFHPMGWKMIEGAVVAIFIAVSWLQRMTRIAM
jgi:tight adherence protein B